MPGPALHPTAWLYTRHDASVTLTLDDSAGSVSLMVRGPGDARSTHTFSSTTDLMMFVHAQEERLREAGFQLQAVAERRSGRERRGAPRDGVSDRRQRAAN